MSIKKAVLLHARFHNPIKILKYYEDTSYRFHEEKIFTTRQQYIEEHRLDEKFRSTYESWIKYRDHMLCYSQFRLKDEDTLIYPEVSNPKGLYFDYILGFNARHPIYKMKLSKALKKGLDISCDILITEYGEVWKGSTIATEALEKLIKKKYCLKKMYITAFSLKQHDKNVCAKHAKYI